MTTCDRCQKEIVEADLEEDNSKAMAFHRDDMVIYLCAPCIAEVYATHLEEMSER